jgi:hypothetical protein
MSRHLLILFTPKDRERAYQYIMQAPVGTRIEIKAVKRSLPQNDLMWSMLSEIAVQKEHHGRKYAPDVWKALFLNGWQKEISLIPTLDGSSLLPLTRTSDLSREEMTSLIDFIDAWAAQNGVKLSGPNEAAA